MNWVASITISIGLLLMPTLLLAQTNSLQAETRQLLNLVRDNTNLSHAQKIVEYEALLEKENNKSPLNNAEILLLNYLIVNEMKQQGDYAKIKALFETLNFLNDINKSKENINSYVRLLTISANAYLMLHEYDHASKLIAETEPLISSEYIKEDTKFSFFMTAGQFNVMIKKYKDGIRMLRLALKAVEDNPNLNEIEKPIKLSSVFSHIGNTYYELHDYENAVKYYERVKKQIANSPPSTKTLVLNHNMASSKLELSQWEEALNTATLAAEQAQSIKSDVFFASSNEIIARSQHGLGRSAEAIESIRASINIYKEINNTQWIVEALAFEADFHISLDNWDEARKNIMEAHATIVESKNQVSPTIKLLETSFLVEENSNNLAKALFYQKQLAKLKDESFKTIANEGTQALMLNFELDLAEEKSLRLEQENKIKSIIIERNQSKHKFLISVISGIIILLLILVYVYMLERKLKTKMIHLAMTDALTGCPNRRNVMHQAKDMLSNHVGKNDSMIIAILDVDDFKAINDTFGHDAGDKALQTLVSIIADALRETDVIGRYGGEEFIILLPSAGEKEITKIFYRIQSALKNHTYKYEDKNVAIPITVSIGATIISHISKELNENEQKLLLSNIIKSADNKVYEAKNEGKDQLKLVYHRTNAS